MSRGSYLICWAVALLVAASPLPFGSVDPVPLAALEICLLATAAAWMVFRWRARQTALPWKDPLLIAGAVLLGYGLLQIVPLPISVVEALSPASAAMKRAYSPVTPDWTALSLYPYATWRSCIGLVCWCLTALMVRHNALDLKGRLVAAGGLVAGGLFQAGYGLFEFISGRQHIFGFQKEYFTDVATGTFISRNNYAGYLEMAIPVALALAVLCLDRAGGPAAGPSAPLRRRLAAASGKESFRALLLLMGAFLMGTALLMSRSRAGIVSVGFSLVMGGLALGLQGRSRRFALCSVAVAGLVFIFASQIDILPVVQRFQSLGNEFGSGYGRLQVWKQAVPMLSAYSLFGSGMGTWEMAFSPFRTDGTQVKVDFAHNDYLEFAAEAGLFGLVFLGMGVALVLRSRARAGDRADEIGLAAGLGLAALALHSLTDFHLSIPADALTVSVLAGLFLRVGGPAAPEGARAGRERRPPAGRAGWTRAAVGAACAACLLALALAAAVPAAAQMSSHPAPKTDDIMDTETLAMSSLSLDPAEDLCPACRLEPFNAGRYIEAASRARQRLLRDVEALLQVEASGDLPDLASKQYLARRIDQAIVLVQQGLALAPASGRGHMEAGLLHFGRFVLIGLPPQASDDFEKARGEFGKALELQPWRAASFRRVARLMAPLWDECDEEQREFIARAARRAVEIDPGARDIKDVMERMGV